MATPLKVLNPFVRIVILICTLFLLGVPVISATFCSDHSSWRVTQCYDFENYTVNYLGTQQGWVSSGIGVNVLDAGNTTLLPHFDTKMVGISTEKASTHDIVTATGDTRWRINVSGWDEGNGGSYFSLLDSSSNILVYCHTYSGTCRVNPTTDLVCWAGTNTKYNASILYNSTHYIEVIVNGVNKTACANQKFVSARVNPTKVRIAKGYTVDATLQDFDNIIVMNTSGGGDTTPPLVDVAVNDTDITCGQHIYMNATFYDETHLNWSIWWVLNSSFDTIWYDYGPPLNSNMSRSYNYTSLISYGTGTWWLYANGTDQSGNTNQTYVTFSVSEACDLWSPIFNHSLSGLNKTINAGDSIYYKCNTTDPLPVTSFPINHTLNDTTLLSIGINNCSIWSGPMPEGTYYYNLTITDQSWNFAYKYFKIIVNPVAIENVVLDVTSPTNTSYSYLTTSLNLNYTQFNATNCSYILNDVWANLTNCTNVSFAVSEGTEYNLTISAENVTSGHIVRKYLSFSINSAGGLTDEESLWLETIYNEVDNLNLTLIYVFFLVTAIGLLLTYSFKRDNDEGSRGFVLGVVGWFMFLALTFLSFHLELTALRIPFGWLFGGVSLIFGISLFVDVWGSWKKI